MINSAKCALPSFLTILQSLPDRYCIYTCKLFYNIYFIDPKFNSIIYRKQKIIRCPICFHEVMSPKKSNNCRHVFCKFCLENWYKIKPNCPMCRAPIEYIMTPDIQSEEILEQMDEYVCDFLND